MKKKLAPPPNLLPTASDLRDYFRDVASDLANALEALLEVAELNQDELAPKSMKTIRKARVSLERARKPKAVR